MLRRVFLGQMILKPGRKILQIGFFSLKRPPSKTAAIKGIVDKYNTSARYVRLRQSQLQPSYVRDQGNFEYLKTNVADTESALSSSKSDSSKILELEDSSREMVVQEQNKFSEEVVRISESDNFGDLLPFNLRNQFEDQIGINLSSVRIHTDPESAQFVKEKNADAITIGNHIYSDPEKINFESPKGKAPSRS